MILEFFRSVGFLIGNVRQGIGSMESGLGIKYRGGGEEGQESQFTSVYSLFFMQAAIIAHNICSGFKAFKLIRKKKYI